MGTRIPIYCLAAGKALLAALDDREIDVYFAQVPLEPFTPHSVTDQAALRAELADIHATGIYGLGMDTIIDGVPIGAFAVAIPVARFSADLATRVVAKLHQATTLFVAAEAPPAV